MSKYSRTTYCSPENNYQVEKDLPSAYQGQPPAKIPNPRGASGSSGVYTTPSRNRMQQAQDDMLSEEEYDPSLGPSSVGFDGSKNEDNQQNPDFGGQVVDEENKDEWDERLNAIANRIQGLRKSLPIRKNLMANYIPEGDYSRSEPISENNPRRLIKAILKKQGE